MLLCRFPLLYLDKQSCSNERKVCLFHPTIKAGNICMRSGSVVENENADTNGDALSNFVYFV